MRLLIATGLYPPEIGGPATYAKLLEERLPRKGVEVSVLPFRDVRHLPRIVRHVAYAWKIMLLARSVDCILVQDTVSTGLPAAIASLFTRKPLVVRVPGDYAWEQGAQRFGVQESLDEFQSRSYGLRVGIFRAIQRFVVRRASSIIAPSKYLAGIVSQWVPKQRKVNVIYNGVDFSSAPQGIEREQNLIVSSGRLVPWKGFSELIDIVARRREWRLAILGDGPDAKTLLDKADARGVADRVTFVGQVPHDEAVEWFARAALFVLNSKYEGFSHTLIEAMSVGTPVVATRVGGNPEVVQDGVSGILVDAGNDVALEDALVRVMSDGALRKKLGSAAAARAKNFSIEKTLETTAKLLRKCA